MHPDEEEAEAGEEVNQALAKNIREQAKLDAYREVAAQFRAMPWWKRLRLALFLR